MSAVVTWKAPIYANGSPVTGYIVRTYVGQTAKKALRFNSTATTQTIRGLVNGGHYTFMVAAMTKVATGGQSSATAAITIGSPSPPTHVTASTREGLRDLAMEATNFDQRCPNQQISRIQVSDRSKGEADHGQLVSHCHHHHGPHLRPELQIPSRSTEQSRRRRAIPAYRSHHTVVAEGRYRPEPSCRHREDQGVRAMTKRLASAARRHGSCRSERGRCRWRGGSGVPLWRASAPWHRLAQLRPSWKEPEVGVNLRDANLKGANLKGVLKGART